MKKTLPISAKVRSKLSCGATKRRKRDTKRMINKSTRRILKLRPIPADEYGYHLGDL